MRNTIKLKIQIAIAVIIAIVSGVQAWVSVNQLHEETTSTLTEKYRIFLSRLTVISAIGSQFVAI